MNIKKFKSNAKCLVALMIILQILLMPLAVFAEGVEGDVGGVEASGGGNEGDTGGTGDSGGSSGSGTIGETGGTGITDGAGDSGTVGETGGTENTDGAGDSGTVGETGGTGTDGADDDGAAGDAGGTIETDGAGDEGSAGDAVDDGDTDGAGDTGSDGDEAPEFEAAEVEVATDEGVDETTGGGNSYVASITPNGVVGNKEATNFTVTFEEVGASQIGSFTVKLPNTGFKKEKVGQSLSATDSEGRAWTGGLVGRLLSLHAVDSGHVLTTGQSVSADFVATPKAIGTQTITTKAWTDNNYGSSGGKKNVPNSDSGQGPVYDGNLSVTVSDTIQGAIDSPSIGVGDTIVVHPGTYTENVEIDKVGLTLSSTGGRDDTIVDNPNVGSETAGIAVVANMGVVTVDGFTVNNFRNGITQGTASAEGTAFHVLNNKVIPENINTKPYLRNGIQVSGNGSQVIGNYIVGAPLTSAWASTGIHVVNASNVLVRGNTVNTSAADIGIGVYNYSALIVENITIDDNTVIGAGNGIRVSGRSEEAVAKEVANVTILNNILNNGNRGINVQKVTLKDVSIEGNEIHNNSQQGVRFSSSASLSGYILVNDNSIVGNTDYGVINQQTGFVVDATNNWWGDASGPSGEGPGTGDAVSVNVLFDPWYINAAMTQDSNYVPPVPPGPGGGFYSGFGMPAFTPLSLTPPGTPGDGETGPVAQTLALAPEAPLVSPGQFLVILPDDPETTPDGMVTVQFVQAGTAEELASLLTAYEAMLLEFDENWENLTDSEYAYSFIDLAVAYAAIMCVEARLSGDADALNAAVQAYLLALESIDNYGDQIAEVHMEVIMEVMAAIADQLVALGAEL